MTDAVWCAVAEALLVGFFLGAFSGAVWEWRRCAEHIRFLEDELDSFDGEDEEYDEIEDAGIPEYWWNGGKKPEYQEGDLP